MNSDSRMLDEPLITIFTPTYNRKHTLHRVFDSLRSQSMRDLEWLVIDDGSTDGTEELVAGWIKTAEFPVRYVRQEHSGKHFAHNLALREARGRFFTALDSDDALVPDALEKLFRHWNDIPASERHCFYSVDGLCQDQYGNIVGDKFPVHPLDSDQREMKYVHRIRGEKWGVGPTDILRRYPFPEIAKGQYLPEGIVWLDVAKEFKSRYVNEVVRVYHIDDAEPGVTADRKRNLGAHATGNWFYYVWLLNNDLGYFFRSPMPFLKAAIMLPIVGWFSGCPLGRTLKSLHTRLAKTLVLLALPFSLLIYIHDRSRAMVRRSN